jgi:arsenate reductase
VLRAGSPHAAETEWLVREVARSLCPEASFAVRQLGTPGSPSILVGGVELLLPRGEGAVPPRWAVEAVLLRALGPRHFLFLCVGNTARSQLAEGIARSLSPPGVRVSSAGSRPSQVSRQAIAVLAEIGIDISAARSKSMPAVDAATVEAVVTLCAEEVCPVFLGRAWRVHWPLPDPGWAPGGKEALLAAFREVRDELRGRLELLFGRRP